MSLITLLLGIFCSVAPLIGGGALLPVPGAAVFPVYELEVVPRSERELDEREAESMQAAIRSRCEWVGLRGVQVRREGRAFLVRVENGLIRSLAAYSDALDELETVLNERGSLQLLRVHPDSETLVMDGEVQELLAQYESAVIASEENGTGDMELPVLPELPLRLRAADYMLAEWPVVSPEDGSASYEYLVVQRPEAAAEEGMLVTEQELESAEAEPARSVVACAFTPHGAAVLTRLTRSMKRGEDRLAILLNGVVMSAPVVHAELGRQCFISGLSPEQCAAVAGALMKPLPVQVRISARREVK